TQADLEVSMDEAGTAYYVVVPDGATAPTADEVVAGTNYGTVTLIANGTIDVTAGGGTYTSAITGLTDKTDYDVYVVAEDDEDTPNRQTETTKVDLYTIRPPDVLLNADFEMSGSLAPFTQVNITGEQIWAQGSFNSDTYAKINGYTTVANENEDWLISPAVNVSAAESVILSFITAMEHSGGSLKVMISSDFSGTYSATDIADATWTDITSNFAFSSGSYAWTSSGDYSLDAYTGEVYIAFVYTSTSEGAATWEVDNVRITGYLLPGSDATLSDLKVDGATIESFDPATLSYEMILDASVTTPPAVTFTTTDATATAVVTDATNLAGDAAARTTTVVVTAADGTTTKTYSILFNPIIAVTDLAALRAVASDNYDRLYQVTGEVVVSGLNESQRHQKFVQDATAGVLIDDAGSIITTAYSVGDGITGLTGTLSEYNKLLQFIPYRDPGAASSSNNTLTPEEVTVAEFTGNQENYESELVTIIGVAFADANGTAAFKEKTNYSISAGSDATILRTIFLGTDLNDKVIPYMADVTGIATVFNDDAQLAPRNYADLVIYSSDATLSDLQVSGTTVTGFDPATMTYNVSLAAGTTAVPAVTATATEANATVVITPATSLTGDAAARTTKVDVTSHDKSAVKNYTVVFTVATGIADNLGHNLRIYPIPAYEELTIEGLSGVTMIEIFDVTGVKLSAMHCEGESMVKIPVSQLARGIYFIRLSSADETMMRRFVKE
ncbi:MAG TPA: choice-of-anchor J domain-containing protein, partial [Bacteroidales bacterium]|nr:choice-of-anchor J domain-containing protein [Bacteroidales bacterium]